MQSDAELVEAVLGGDRASFAVLVRRHERAVLAIALGVLRDHHAAQDAAQDTFVTAYEQLGMLRRRGRFAPWVLGIARRRAIDLWRRRSRSPQNIVELDSIAANPGGSLDQAAGEVFEAIDRLPEQYRRILLLRYCDRLSVREIAEAMGSPVGTVTSRLSRARARLRRSLGEES